jgi:ABC-type transport system substrate-binding protein
MKTLYLARIIVALLFFLSLSACTEKTETASDNSEKEAPPAQSIQHGGIYKTTLFNTITTLDPTRVKDIYSETLIQQLFDRLVKFGPYLQVEPALAETWTIDQGGTRYTFYLRKNARFHNGDPVTAADAAFSIRRLLRVSPQPEVLPHLLKIQGAREYQKGNSESVAGLKAVDDQTLQVTLEAPYGPFLTALGMNLASIIQKVDEVQFDAQLDKHPVGSGPFQLESWEKGKSIQLARFPEHYDGPAYLDGIKYTIYPGDQYDTAVDDFKNGTLDEIPVFGGQVREKLSGMTDLQWFHRPLELYAH